MHRYVAISWPTDDRAAAHEAKEASSALLASLRKHPWNTLVSADGLVVYSTVPTDASIRTYVLPRSLGVVFGQLFSAEDARPLSTSELPSTAIVQTKGRWLHEHCWGRYVAFLRTPLGEQCHAVRDCSGQIPLFLLTLEHIRLFFSDARDLQALHPSVTLNTSYLAAFIARQPLHVRETGINEITEVLPGESVTASAAGSLSRVSWNARTIVPSEYDRSYTKHRASLVTVTESVIGAWARIYQRILLSLSGGFDSAVVLGCLNRLGLADKVVCVTQYTRDTSDDERFHARAAAEMAGVPLIEIPRFADGRVFAEKLAELPPDPRPDISKNNRILTLAILSDVASQFGCDSIWTGQGGDQLYLQAHHALAAADYLFTHAMRPWQLPRQIYDAALLSRKSVWGVLAETLKFGLQGSKPPPPMVRGYGQRFLASCCPPVYSEDFIAAQIRAGSLNRTPPGKVIQLDTLVDLLNRHKPIIGLEHPYEHHPLISKPLIDLSVSIPTHHLLRGGRQRGMAREAFSDRMPACIVRREDKGGISDQMRALLRGSFPYIRDSLLGGTLVSLGILNRKSLEGLMREEETFSPDDLFPILACISAEAWIQHWKPAPAGHQQLLTAPVARTSAGTVQKTAPCATTNRAHCPG